MACAPPDRLTREDAERLVRATFVDGEPVYADVPLEVSWSPAAPRDEFDVRSIETLEALAAAGLVTLERSGDGSEGRAAATLTADGVRILGQVPSVRGPAARGRIAVRKIEGVGRIESHPSDPTIARVEVLWRYQQPTPLYAMFSTRQDKPLEQTFASILSVTWSEGAWRGRVIVRKASPAILAD